MIEEDLSIGKTIGALMKEQVRILKKNISEHADVKLTIEQLGLLHAISINKYDVIQQDMAAFLGKDKSVILRIVDSLEKKELVRRVVDTKDRRKKHLMVTKQGEIVLKKCMEIDAEITTKIQKGLSASDISTFYKVMNHFKNNAEKL